MSFLLISFNLSSGCLFRPHHVNQGGVQSLPHKSLFTNPTLLKSPLRRHRSGRDSQVLSVHADKVRELLHVTLAPHHSHNTSTHFPAPGLTGLYIFTPIHVNQLASSG